MVETSKRLEGVPEVHHSLMEADPTAVYDPVDDYPERTPDPATELSEMNAAELVGILSDTPERVDEVEAAELSRPEDGRRKSVLEAVARIRAG